MMKQASITRWAPTFAIFCIFFGLSLIVGTIVLALIPLYLQRKAVTPTDKNSVFFNAIYATNLTPGRSLTISNIDALSAQMRNNLPSKPNMNMYSAQFLSARAMNKKKRDTSESQVTCEQNTDLHGDILHTQHVLNYPMLCWRPNCQKEYLKTIENEMKNSGRMTLQMKFTNGETELVQTAFCSFSISAIENLTSSTTISSGTTSVTTSSTSISNATKYIYLLDQDNNFFQFNPTTYDLTFIGSINCSATAYPYSMALQSTGKAWALFTDGNLYTFDIKTAQCQNTSYVPEQGPLVLFGMNFGIDESTNTEKLYISSDSSNPPYRLSMIDTNTLDITDIGYYRTISARGELTSTVDGKLFGLFEGMPFNIAEINQTTGEIISKTAQNTIDYQSDSSHFAFASYLSNFYLFVGNATYTDIFLYDTSTKTTSKQKTISNGIVGASAF